MKEFKVLKITMLFLFVLCAISFIYVSIRYNYIKVNFQLYDLIIIRAAGIVCEISNMAICFGQESPFFNSSNISTNFCGN